MPGSLKNNGGPEVALGHPLRVSVLHAIINEPTSPIAIAKALDCDLGRVSYHVQVLYDAGLILLVDTRRRRGATEHVYGPNPDFERWPQIGAIATEMSVALLETVAVIERDYSS